MYGKISVAGNIIVDRLYPINGYPARGQLVKIENDIRLVPGGAVCNVGMDLASLAPDTTVSAIGCVGRDGDGDFVIAEMEKGGMDCSGVLRTDRLTAFTAVMSDRITNERTFFTHAGANDLLDVSVFDFASMKADLFHIGYILLLPALDAEDAEYGTKMAKLLHRVQKLGIKTSIDVVSESGDRFARLVTPALKYADYCIINELEAQQTTGVVLRDGSDRLIKANLPAALKKLKDLGVSTWAVIHCPELGCGMDEAGKYHEVSSLKLPRGYIKGTVGAGDAFCAGILYGAEKDMSMPKALKLAACTAAASLREVGASDGVKTVKEVLELYDIYGE